jgi:hypothetical protein
MSRRDVMNRAGDRWPAPLYDGIDGAEVWCGFGILAHNAVKIAGLIDERDARCAARVEAKRTISPPSPPATGPPQAGPPPDTLVA